MNNAKMRSVRSCAAVVAVTTGVLAPASAYPDGDVSVHLKARPDRIRPGETATLLWQSQAAQSCEVNGAWSGSRPRQGTARTGPLWQSRTYEMTCTNGVRSAVSAVKVEVQTPPLVSWAVPDRNRDGSRIGELGGYWLYWGRESGEYQGRQWVRSTDQSQMRPEGLPPGTYYIALTAVNERGMESARSNEIRIEVP